MPSVTITLTDTPTGGVSVRTDFAPAVGRPCSLAQSAALDLLRITARQYGLPEQVASTERLVSEARLASAEAGLGVSQL